MNGESGTDRYSLLIVDLMAEFYAEVLSHEFEVLTAESPEAAQALFSGRKIDVILTSYVIGRMNGLRLLEWVQGHSPQTVRLIWTATYGLEEQLEDAVKNGVVFRFLWKLPFRREDLLEMLEAARMAVTKSAADKRKENPT
jgi:DNA-binding NtrC family response regulator